ncbi:hypothetical protein BDZ97DRAFT_1795586 [Flammula alnicola]|nr:hypothetical protein BDZ97DRAFT_1795586 [Flammula alnicola]
MKSSSKEPVASTSTSATKPTTQAQPGPSSKPHSRTRGNQQPTAADLKKLGIKVRDFAYESTLPPVPTVYCHPRQIQPSVNRNPVQRQSTETDEDGAFSQQSQGGTKKPEKTPTEPALTPAPPARQGGFLNIEDYDRTNDNIIDSQKAPSFPESPVNSQVPPTIFESQASEPTIKTPLVMPNGSLQWNILDISDIPPSQLDTESQAAVPEMFSYSQLGFSPPTEYSQQNVPLNGSQDYAISTASSPLSPAPSSPAIPASSPSTSVKAPSSNLSQSQTLPSANRRTKPTHDLHSPVTPKKPTGRYYLRKRKTPSPPINPNATKRMKLTILETPVRSNTVSAQSMHSRNKPNDKPNDDGGFPSSRPLRPPSAANGRGKRKRV